MAFGRRWAGTAPSRACCCTSLPFFSCHPFIPADPRPLPFTSLIPFQAPLTWKSFPLWVSGPLTAAHCTRHCRHHLHHRHLICRSHLSADTAVIADACPPAAPLHPGGSTSTIAGAALEAAMALRPMGQTWGLTATAGQGPRQQQQRRRAGAGPAERTCRAEHGASE